MSLDLYQQRVVMQALGYSRHDIETIEQGQFFCAVLFVLFGFVYSILGYTLN